MACFHPLTAYRSSMPNEDGKHSIVFDRSKAHDHEEIKLPCGRCVGCRLDRSKQWAVRCVHEAQLHENNCFITLTFSPEHLEKRDNPMSLDVADWQKFMKRLKKHYNGKKIRFYHCGEYGSKNGRPHYHACLFGHDFDDKVLWKITPSGHRLYRSPTLERIWPFGFSTIGEVTFESAAYCARYIMKKVNGDMAEEHYTIYDDDTGEIYAELKPEYTTMSRRPGIAKEWLDKYIDDVYPHDYVVMNGVKMKPPRYYDNVLKTERPYEFDDIQFKRLTDMNEYENNPNTPSLESRERVQKAKLNQLQRNL